MKISIIIPTYNDEKNLETCLSAISESAHKPYEVIVVDDASTDYTREVVNKFGYTYTRLELNRGQATARNVGAHVAKGEILFFIDSDVRIRKNTIGKVAEAYKNPQIQIYQGIASKTPLNKGFGPELLALKWYYMMHTVRRASYLHTHVFSIRRKIFLEIGGFNERFRPPGGGEDFELGHRLRKRYVIHTDPTLLVEHVFQGIIPRARSLYRRSYVWASLFSQTARFEKTNASLREALIGIIDILAMLSLVLWPIGRVYFFLFILLIATQTILNRGFYWFLLNEAGFIFLVRSIVPTMLWSIVQILGATDFYIRKTLGMAR